MTGMFIKCLKSLIICQETCLSDFKFPKHTDFPSVAEIAYTCFFFSHQKPKSTKTNWLWGTLVLFVFHSSSCSFPILLLYILCFFFFPNFEFAHSTPGHRIETIKLKSNHLALSWNFLKVYMHRLFSRILSSLGRITVDFFGFVLSSLKCLSKGFRTEWWSSNSTKNSCSRFPVAARGSKTP